MPKTREQKEKTIQDLQDKLKQSKGVVFTSQRGLSVEDASNLRKSCKKENVEYYSTKKTLLNIALDKSEIKGFESDKLEGIVGVVFGYEDEVAPAKVAYEFSKDKEQLKLHQGILEGIMVGEDMVMQLAKLPSKPELYAKVVGSLQSPISGFVNVLGGTMRGFVQVLNQIKEQKA